MDKIVVILFSSIKFAYVFPLVVLGYKYSFVETLLWSNLGGALGVFVFCSFSHLLIRLWKYLIKRLRLLSILPPEKEKKVFSRRSRFIIKAKNYGFYGVIILTPILLSIPIGSFLLMRFFPDKKRKMISLMVSNIIWSLVLTTIFFMIKYKIL